MLSNGRFVFLLDIVAQSFCVKKSINEAFHLCFSFESSLLHLLFHFIPITTLRKQLQKASKISRDMFPPLVFFALTRQLLLLKGIEN